MSLTDAEREQRLKELLGGNVIGAMDRLRVALRRYGQYPRSERRQEALIQRLEDAMAEQVNHLYSVCGSLVVGPIECMQEQTRQQQREIETLREQVAELAVHIAELAGHERAVGE